MKSDNQLQRDVLDELGWEPSVQESEIGIAAKDGVVTLSGFVDSYSQKLAAEKAVKRVGGVKALANDIEVRLPGEYKRSDTELAHAAAHALTWDIDVPSKITARVMHGWITIEGPASWQYQKQAAERSVRNLTGVRGVVNNIVVTPPVVSTYDVTRKIKDALRRTAERDAEHIVVEAADGKVTLKGTVHSLSERREAEYAAWAAPGVTAVDDRLVVQD